eukprot:TRINITY_DN26999_c0_g1_i1.p1 TRINITY_DN26999_c0_g1~~TRINITY_DN26999_c0_g1_i1.p1  ORF type:complete len:396 (-),score=82.45 TRINITY_DN26999_c0_g1_i1:331-1518(-)
MMSECLSRQLGTQGAPVSNTLQVVLPPGMGPAQAKELLAGFGEVMFTKVLPSPVMPTMLVSYYDCRCAAQAQLALGFQSCRPCPQNGNRWVRLPGNVKLSPEEVKYISQVETDPQDAGSYVVEFFDVRHAQRTEERFGVAATAVPAATAKKKKGAGSAAAPATLPGGVELPPGLEGFQQNNAVSSARPVARPAYVLPGRTAASAAKVEVVIKGLPKALCTEAFLETMLEQAGLESDVIESRCSPGRARVGFNDRHAAKRCIDHFSGRQWGGPSAELVVATLVGAPAKVGNAAFMPGLLKNPSALVRSSPLEMVPEDVFCSKARTHSEDTDTTVASSSSNGASLEVSPPGMSPYCSPEKDPAAGTDASTADGASDVGEQEERLPAPVLVGLMEDSL